MISSGVGYRLLAGGLRICGGGMKGSLRWASPSVSKVETRL